MSYRNIVAESNFNLQAFGQFGFRRVVSGTTLPAGEQYRVLQFVEETTISFTSEVGDSFTAQVMPAGFVLYGLFSGITVTSGSVIAYIA
jgi:hypothetical protein